MVVNRPPSDADALGGYPPDGSCLDCRLIDVDGRVAVIATFELLIDRCLVRYLSRLMALSDGSTVD